MRSHPRLTYTPRLTEGQQWFNEGRGFAERQQGFPGERPELAAGQQGFARQRRGRVAGE